MTGYAKGSASGAVETSDTINAAIGKLENRIDGKVDALDATVRGETSDGKVNVTVVQENGVLTSVTVVGTDIASDSALTAEIAARKAVDGQTGQTYAANASANYISNANSLNDADVKLDAALKAEETRAKNAETAIDTVVGLTKADNPSETRSFTPTSNYGGTGASAATSVMDNMQKIDTALKAVSDKANSIQYKVNGTTLEFFGMGEHA
jgi:hypothetical protein